MVLRPYWPNIDLILLIDQEVEPVYINRVKGKLRSFSGLIRESLMV